MTGDSRQQRGSEPRARPRRQPDATAEIGLAAVPQTWDKRASDSETPVTRRTRKAAVLVCAVAFVALLPVAGMLTFAHQQTLERSRERLAEIAGMVARRTEEVLLSAEIVLGDLRFDAREGCSETLVAEFRNVTLAALAVEGVGRIDAEGRLACSSFGLHEPPIPIDQPPVIRPPGSLVGFARQEGTALAPGVINTAELSLDGARLIVAFSPARLVDIVPPDAVGADGRIEIRLSGLILGEAGAPQTRASDYLVARQAVGLYDTAVKATASRDWALAAWRENALVTGGLGVVAGVILAAGAVQLGRKRLSLAAELRDGLDNGEFEIWYQPVIELATGRCRGAEALIRWRHPERDLIPPDLFIALAEETGTIIPMTRWLMEEMGRQLGALLRDDRSLHIAINLAPAHTRSFDIVEDARRIVETHGIAPEQILFELTERGLIDDPDCREVVLALSALGSAVAVDDFGTGYSSLAYIDKFRLDYLKLDKAFVAALGAGSPTEKLTDVIIEMAKSLNLKIIAEGVETDTQADYLRARGVDYAQGWRYSKPLEAHRFLGFIAANRAERAAAAGERVADPAPA